MRSQLGHGEKANNKRDFSNIGKLLPSLGDKDKKEAVLIEPYMMGVESERGLPPSTEKGNPVRS